MIDNHRWTIVSRMTEHDLEASGCVAVADPRIQYTRRILDETGDQCGRCELAPSTARTFARYDFKSNADRAKAVKATEAAGRVSRSHGDVRSVGSLPRSRSTSLVRRQQ